MAKYIVAKNNITFFHNGRPVNVQKGSTQYAKVLKAFDLPESEQDAAIAEILDAPKFETKIAEKEGFSFVGGNVFVDGEALPQVLVDKINSLKNEGLPITLFLNFWRNLRLNPSSSSVNELYDFLAYKELPITEDGCFLAYRGLQSDFYSKHGNLNTKVLKGKVNARGQIYNGVGEEIEIQRNNVDDNRDIGCSVGVHAGSYSYAQDWSNGKLVVVKINPKDVVSVPKDCSFQKLRCCAYVVVSEVKEEIAAPATTSKGEAIVDESQADLSAFEKRIQSYLDKKINQGHDYVSVSQIRNSFSPDYPDKKRVLAALNALGYVWRTDVGGKEYVEI